MTDSNNQFPEERLEQMAEEIGQIRAELGEDKRAIANLQRVSSELLDIARLHQQALRISQQNADADRAVIRDLQSQVRGIQTENQRIWEYLLGQQRNGNGGSN